MKRLSGLVLAVRIVQTVYQPVQMLAQLLFGTAHQQRVFKRILGGLVQLVQILGHDFDFFGAGNGRAVITEPFGHFGLWHGLLSGCLKRHGVTDG